MQSLQIERQTDQAPLASSSLLAAQRELPEAQYLFNDADHRLDRAFAQAVDPLPNRTLEFVGHLLLRAGILPWRLWQLGKALPPTWMVWVASGRDIGLDRPPLENRNVRLAKVARVQCGRIWGAQIGWDGVQGWFDFLLIGGMVREALTHDQQAVLVDRDLGIIVLLEALAAAVLHDPRVGVGKVVLIFVAWTGRWRLGRSSARRPSGLTLFLGPFLHLGII